jgi:hypothetical protein
LAAWLLPGIAAEQPGGVVSAVFESDALPETKHRAEARAAAGSDSVLLLRNGEMIQGRVTRCGDRFEIRVPGGEIYVKAAEVQHECRDVQEVYLRKTALIRRDNAMDHFELAQWCIKAGLLENASRELAEATAMAPQHPLIEVLQRRLKAASTPLPQAEPDSKSTSVGPTPQELDRMVRGMPPKTVEIFAQSIQPMLVNNCSAAACHGQSASNGFRLLRLPTDSPPSRLLTQRNLHAALEWLDRDSPEASPLLTYATRPHGTARVPVFTDRQVIQFRQLRDWCYRVAKADTAVMQASYNEPVGSWGQGGHTGGRNPQGAARGPRRQHGGANGEARQKAPPSDAPDSGTIDLRGGAASEGPRRAAHRGGTAPNSSSADPFDPEPFNRQFGPGDRAMKEMRSGQPAPLRDSQEDGRQEDEMKGK